MHTASSAIKEVRSRERKTLTFTQQGAAIGQPFCHHGDQSEALGKGPEVMRKRARGGARRGEEGTRCAGGATGRGRRKRKRKR